MTNTQTVEWTIEGYYFFITFVIFDIILFTLLLIHVSLMSSKHTKLLINNPWAVLLWITIILWSIVKVFINMSIIEDFEAKCYEQDISCLRCTIGGHVEHGLFMLIILSRLFAMLRVLEINIQPFDHLAYPSYFIIGIKSFFWVLFISVNIIYCPILQIPYRVTLLKSDTSQQICTESKDGDTTELRNKLIGIYGPIFLLSHVFLCILFIRKVSLLYKMTKDKIFLSPDYQKRRNGVIMLTRIIKPIVQYTILVIVLTINGLMVLKKMADPKGVPLYPVENLVTGLCMVMMLGIGKRWFLFFFGCIQRHVINKFFKKRMNSLEQQPAINISETNKRQKAELNVVSKLALSTIIERTERDKTEASTVLSKKQMDSKWSMFVSIDDPDSIGILMSDSDKQEIVDLQSVTTSEVNAAIEQFL